MNEKLVGLSPRITTASNARACTTETNVRAFICVLTFLLTIFNLLFYCFQIECKNCNLSSK